MKSNFLFGSKEIFNHRFEINIDCVFCKLTYFLCKCNKAFPVNHNFLCLLSNKAERYSITVFGMT